MITMVMEEKLASGRPGGITAQDMRGVLIGIAELVVRPGEMEQMKVFIEEKLASGRPGGNTAKDMRETLTGIFDLG